MRYTSLRPALVLSMVASMVLSLPVLADPWIPVKCADRAEEVRKLRSDAKLKPMAVAFHEYEQSVRNSRPGDPRYVPHPFPDTDEQVIADFEYAMTQRLFRNRTLTAQEANFLKAVRSKVYEYKVLSLVNWLPSRCSGARPKPGYFLVRAYEDGEEVGRGALHVTGILGQFAFIESERSSFADVDGLEDHLAAFSDLDLHPQESQYVITGGFPYRCDPIMPCIAFKSRGKRYVLSHGGLLYQIPPSGPQLSVDEFNDLVRSKPLLTMGRDRPDHPWVAVGYGWREALLVGGTLPGSSE